MGIKVDLKCDRCGFEWRDTNLSDIFDNKLYVSVNNNYIYLCDTCMDEYNMDIDNLKKSFSVPTTKNGSIDQIKVEGIVGYQDLSAKDKHEMGRLAEMRRIQQAVSIKGEP